ncbi:hypothetical protein HYX16_03585 [Candidatus Woesearchaeota archaeon]|nr:hypothetical protein [Candidatus Woesearchaeota archaeon]
MDKPEKDNSEVLEKKVKLEIYNLKSRTNIIKDYLKSIISNKKILLIIGIILIIFALFKLVPEYYGNNISSAAVIPLENETVEILVISPIDVFMKLSCNMKFSDIENLTVKKYDILSWFVEEFEGEKISPRSISIPGSEIDLIIQLKKSKYDEYAVLKEAYLKSNLNGEVIKKLNC